MWQMYDSLVKYINFSNIKSKVKLKFIDVINDEIENYPEALNILRSGYGVAKFHGGIPYEAVYNEIQKCL